MHADTRAAWERHVKRWTRFWNSCPDTTDGSTRWDRQFDAWADRWAPCHDAIDLLIDLDTCTAFWPTDASPTAWNMRLLDLEFR